MYGLNTSIEIQSAFSARIDTKIQTCASETYVLVINMIKQKNHKSLQRNKEVAVTCVILVLANQTLFQMGSMKNTIKALTSDKPLPSST